MKVKLMMAMVGVAASSSMASPFKTLVDWEPADGKIFAAKADATDKEWYGFGGGINLADPESNYVWNSGAVNSNKVVVAKGDSFTISTQFRIDPTNGKNEPKGLSFYFAAKPPVVTNSSGVNGYKLPGASYDLPTPGYNISNGVGFTFEQKVNEGVFVSSMVGDDPSNYALLGFDDLGYSIGTTNGVTDFASGTGTGEIAFDADFVAKLGDDGLFDVSLVLKSGDMSANWSQNDVDFGVSEGDELYFQLFNGADTKKFETVKLDGLTVTIPEPATFGLLGLAGAGLVAYRRRKQL